MINTVCFFRAAQNEIIILRTIHIRIKRSCLIGQFFLHDKQMADIVLRRKQIRIKIGFHIRFRVPALEDLILIRIDQFRFRIPVDALDDFEQCARDERIIMIGKRYKRTLCSRQRRIGILRNMLSFQMPDDPEPAVASFDLLQFSGKRGIRTAPVR